MSKLKLNKDNILNCIIFTVIGLLLIIFRSEMISVLMTVIGVTLVVFGIINLVKKSDTLFAVLEMVIGLVVIFCGWFIAQFVLMICGIVLLVLGVMYIIKGKKSGFLSWFYPILATVIGVMLIVATWVLVDVVLVFVGIMFIVGAVLILFDVKLIK